MSKDWFKHDINARHDVKIVAMRDKYGASGYGAWWMLIEILRDTDGYKLPLREVPLLRHSLNFPEVEAFVDDCINVYFLLESDDEYVWSESLMRRMEAYEELLTQRAAAGKLGGIAKAKQNVASAKQTVAKSGDKIRLDKSRVDKKEKSIDEFATQIDDVFNYFKTKTGSRVSLKTESLRSMVRARLNEGYTVDECCRAIAFAHGDKIGTEQEKFIRIETIFRPSKFSGYLDAQVRATGGNK